MVVHRKRWGADWEEEVSCCSEVLHCRANRDRVRAEERES